MRQLGLERRAGLAQVLVVYAEASSEAVRALLDQAQRAGVKPNGLYLSALRLHPRDLPLPPDPRLVLEVPVYLRRRHGAAATPEGHSERGFMCARVMVLRARECGGRGRSSPPPRRSKRHR